VRFRLVPVAGSESSKSFDMQHILCVLERQSTTLSYFKFLAASTSGSQYRLVREDIFHAAYVYLGGVSESHKKATEASKLSVKHQSLSVQGI